MFDILITGGKIVDGSGNPWYRGDVGIRGGKIAAIGTIGKAEAKEHIDAAGKVVAPGFIDTHVHGDLMVLADPYHEPAIRQGVTTYILGQDGVAMAPASPATLDHMRRYTAGFSGNPALPEPLDYKWTSVADYLACFDNRVALNVAYLIPNGNIRMEFLGLDPREPTPDEMKKMRRLVREGMEQGAVGLSSGLDYIPSRYADTDELSELCKEIAPYNGVYVTHMRRYDPEGLIESMEEVYEIGKTAGCAVHISHFNSKADMALPKVDSGRADGIDVTYDLYCYLAGSSILAMVGLPPWVQEGGVDATMNRLRDKEVRARLREGFEGPRGPLETVRLSFVAAPDMKHLEGHTLAEAAALSNQHMCDFICDVLLASKMAVGCVAHHRQRTQDDVWAMMRHKAHMAGSDGIYTGSRPHPRGCGCFARYLGHHVHGDHTWSLEEAVQHLAAHAANRFGLKDRGFLREGLAADVIVFDHDKVADHSTYEDGRRLATGMEHVIVNGKLVLHKGERTKALPGKALRSSDYR